MQTVSIIFGVGAMLALFSIYQQKTRKGIILSKLSADVCWVVHYLCIGGIAGAIPNFVGIFRELVFVNRKKHKWTDCVIWPILFILVNLALALRTFHSAFNILPIAASALVTVLLWLNNPLLTKLFSIPVCVSFMIYDVYVGSYIGIVNEAISILSIFIFLIKYYLKRRNEKMAKNVFSADFKTEKELIISAGAPIESIGRRISADAAEALIKKGNAFAQEMSDLFISDFEKPGDKMVHVSTFIVIEDTVYMTYYANTKEPSEDPKNQTARLVWAPIDDIDNKTYLDLQTTGDTVGGKTIDMVYDTILMRKDENTLYIMWTARTEENYYRFYCPFDVRTKSLGDIGVNRFKVGDVTNDLSASGIRSALAENGIPMKKTYSDIGIMQKQSYRMENGVNYCYSGLYSGDFTCIIKSQDLVTWEYVSQPDFINDSKWENATYVLGDKVYYFVRQQDTNKCGFLTAYNLLTDTWDQPIEIEDCQSRGDFILYRDALYLFHAPIDREHIGIVKIDTEDITKSEVVLQAKMHTSCFYPFVQNYTECELAMSYTVARKHIRLARFTLSKYIE